jgi:hypothetical protein
MGLFRHDDYWRDYRAEHPRDPRMQAGWGGAPPRPRRGYDAEPRDSGRGYDARDFAYRGMEGAWSTAFNRGAHDPQWDWRQAARHQRVPYAPGEGYDGGYRGHSPHGEIRGYERDYSAGQRGYGRWQRGPEPRQGDAYWQGRAGYDRGYPRPYHQNPRERGW